MSSLSVEVQIAAQKLGQGGIVAYPTEGVYGLGCDPWQGSAVQRLLQLKNRPQSKGLILIAGTLEQLLPFLAPSETEIPQRVKSTWPGPITWILPAASIVPDWIIGQHDSIAVRVSAHPSVRALCQAFAGAIVSTSANVAGQPPARSSLEISRQFGQAVDSIIPGKLGGLKGPTPIKNGVTGEVLRVTASER